MKGKNKKRSWKQIVSVLSCVVVFCTTYALILPAVTMSKDTYCQKEEHTHTEQCYKSEEPLCGLEEGETKDAHVHDESCYENVEVARNLICGLEEDETHVHSEDCHQSEFETRLTCDQEEGEAVEGHTHGDECYKSEEPICNKEEHEHVHQCYSNKEDVEDPNNWAEAYKDINKEEDAKTRILTVAKNELGYKENEANFEVDEKDEEHPYTRYGHLYEDMYGDWNNYFTGYVLKYANVQMNFDKDIDKWQNKTINDQKEEGEEGNVVFFRDEEGKTRTGIVTNIDELKKEIRVIEGDVEGQVKEERVNKDRVIAYLDDQVTIDDLDTPLAGEGAEKEEDKLTQTAKDAEESVEVTATYSKEANLEGTTLKVEYLQTLENGNVQYNIGFYDETGEEKEPAAPVEISIKYLNDQLDGSEEINYIHYKKDGSTEEINSKVEKLEDGSVESKFTTESFSVYETVIIDGVQKVEIEGLDQEYKIGDEVTLKAVTKNIENIDELSYQWQYNEYDAENEEYWFNVKSENNAEYTFELVDEKAYLNYRVVVGPKELIKKQTKEEPKDFVGPVGELQLRKVVNHEKLKNSLRNHLREEVIGEDNDDSSKNETQSGLIVSSYGEVKIASNVTSTSGYTSSNSHDPEKVLHTKSIEYLGVNESQRDDYRLSITSGPISGENPVDLLFVIDTSSSMKKTLNDRETDDDSKRRITILKNNLKKVIPQFINCNTKNRVAFITFDGEDRGSSNSSTKEISHSYIRDSQIALQWTRDTATYTSAINALSIQNSRGTNYNAGLYRAEDYLMSNTSESKKMVIFLSDGLPTFASTTKDKRKGNGSSDNGISQITNTRISEFKTFANNKDIEINCIYYANSTNNTYLSSLSSSGKFYSTAKVDDLEKHLVFLSQGPTCIKGEMTDTLSEYVDFDDQNYNIVVTAYKGTKEQDSQGTKIFESNVINPDGSFTNNLISKDKDIELDGISGKISVKNTIKPTVEIEGKTITLKFDPTWKMDASFQYELSFNVFSNKKAYDTEGIEGYKDIGDEETGETSANEKGLVSNISGSFNFEYEDKPYKLSYQNPVIQIIRTDLTLTKMGNDSPLAGAEFSLYKKDNYAKPIDGHENYKGNLISEVDKPITSGTNGEISLTQLSVGTYYLFEIKSPTGYILAQEPWELTIEAKENRKGKVQLYYSLKDLNKEGDNQIIVKDQPLDFGLRNSSEIISHDRWKYSNETKIAIENEPGKSLPNTGGTGTKLITFSGGAIIATTCLMYGYKKKLKRNRKGGQN